MTNEQIAKTTHQANKAYCESIGDSSQVDWESAPEWQKQSALKGVEAVKAGASAKELHDSWLEFKKDTGWKYGETKSETEKTHPCMVPYEKLPANQRRKDYLFRAVVSALLSEV